MRSISCFPVFASWSSQKKFTKNVTDSRLDPSRGEQLPGKASEVYESPTIGSSQDLAQPSNELECSSSIVLEDWNSKTALTICSSPVDASQETDEGDENGSRSTRSMQLQHVEDWVRNLDELDELDDNSQEEEDEGLALIADGPDQTDPDKQLKDLVLQSLHPLASTARFCGIGLSSPPPLGTFNNLRTLSLSGNSICKIPFGCLPRSLHFLDLSRNKLSAIDCLRGLNRLRVLNLSHNRISRIGHGLGNCPSIRELYLSGNKISAVEGLHRLSKLFLVDLSNNRLTTARSLLQLAANYGSLQVLNLLGNAVLLNLGDEQLKRLLAAIAPHLRYLNKQPIKALSTLDLMRFRATEANGARRRRSSGSKSKQVERLQAHSSTRRLHRKHF